MFDLKKLVRKSAPAATGSITGSIQHMDDLAGLYDLALACYGDAIEGVGQHAPATPRALREEHRRKLKQIRGLLALPGKQSLEGARKHLDAELQAYGKGLEKHIHQSEKDVKEIMAMMATMADSLASREKQYNVRFRGIAKQLRLLTTTNDLAEIRMKLASEVEQLEKYVEDMARDTQAALERVKGDLQVREQAAQQARDQQARDPQTAPASAGRGGASPTAWVDSAVDPTTQLAGRPEGLAMITTLKRNDVRFCLARFSVDPFDPLLAKYGRGVMDAVLKEISFRLKEGFPAASLVARWNDADFLVVSESSLPDLAMQVTEIERKLALTFSIPGRGEKITVCCRSSAIQSLRTETTDEMITRALANRELAPTR